ncbi:Stp1/IreP family PP2C-type Ser/Thr phosphatase [Heyndrickxia vini]|uniref:Stp1/IreP family PP2C-type Ser/Thr phosphatase n=1 Tax=Heyndrickxia vini TaxID=1476025 RepID=A0ABX7DYE9_9BACI|nr:Stp1/IreP family PP2C-type Ser/Thr phosphatase [Heyndrickxia vini]QQZ07991.1 Stp1/IreP family PP2C-type Ser/Thr phosphatase [Heyndrickxia vini]
MRAVFRTDKGKIRQRNEDNGGFFVNSTGDRLAIVADGMGGHNAGDVASKMTVDFFYNEWEKSSEIDTAESAEKWFSERVDKINKEILNHSRENTECEGMGTTLVAAICTNDFATIVNIGDSRCYIFNENGFKQITEDHSLVNELVKTGIITKEDAEHHPRKNLVLKALGTEEKIEADIKTILIEEEDYLLLCSDGLSDKMTELQIKEILENGNTIEEKAQTLIDLANENGGEDNITLILIKVATDVESGCNEC